MQKRLYRSEQNKMLAGVCGGIGEYFNIDPTLVRLGFVALSIVTRLFGGILIYIIATIIIPSEYKIRGDR
nr:PspC domain-containing protein [Tissierella sp.]